MLRPSMTLLDIFGAGHAYVPRAHDYACYWLHPNAQDRDMMSGSMLTVAGAMPVVCSAGFFTEPAAVLLSLAGLELGSQETITFMANESMAAAEGVDRAHHLVFSHALPADHPLNARSWIERELQVFLNNKANLARLAPNGHFPERAIVDRQSFFQSPDRVPPYVVKAVTDQSTAGGYAIKLCRSSADVEAAAARFASLELVVVEEMLDIAEAPCLNFMIDRNGRTYFLGHADQILSLEGQHGGNWIDRRAILPEPAVEVAGAIVRKAADLGYRGIAGVDMALTRDGRILALDLNFRTNGSTPALFLAAAITESLGKDVVLSRRFKGRGTAADFAGTLEPFVRRSQVVPLSLFDPTSAGYPSGPPVVQALIPAASRGEAQEIAKALETLV